MVMFRVIAAVLLVMAMGFPAPAAAQETPEAPEATAMTPEQAEALATLLRDPSVRDALLAELDRLSSATPATTPAAPPKAPSEPDTVISVVREIAKSTQTVAEEVAAGATRFWAQLSRAPQTLDDVFNVSPDVVLDAVRELAFIFGATVLIFLLLRMVARRLDRRMDVVAADLGAFRTGLMMLASLLIDAAVVGLAWTAGYAVALLALGDFGEIGIRQSLYLNAFLTVEMVKVLLRGVLSPVAHQLRPIDIPDRAAVILTRWPSIVVSLLGYGQLLVVPIINQNVSWAAGRAVSTLLAVFAILMLISLVLRFRRSVAAWLQGEAQPTRRSFRRGVAHNWWLFALVYLVGVLGIVLARPGNVLFSVLTASAEIAAAVVVGLIATNFLGRAIARGIRLPLGVTERLPLLQGRLNAFVPKALMVLRAVIFVAIVAFALDTLGMIDISAWLASQVGVELSATFLSVVLIVVFSFAIWLALSSWVDYRLNPEYGGAPTARERTLLSLLRNAANVVIVVITLMFVLSEIGIDIAPLIASAGVLGLAIGFGAQKLVQDIITGVFIQLENAMNVGDVVTAGGTSGTVESLTIRSVALRDVHGVYHIIPFSSVDMVSNYMRDFGFHVADMGIAYREDIDEAKQAMMDAFDELKASDAWGSGIIGDLQWFGVQELGDSAVVLRARIKCEPGSQWGIGRAYNELLKKIFDARGIEIPYPHQTIYFGELKDGAAPPVNVKMGAVAAAAGGAAAVVATEAAIVPENDVPDDEPEH